MTSKNNILFLILMVSFAGYLGWRFLGSTMDRKGDFPHSPVSGNKGAFYGDPLLSPAHLGSPDDLAKKISKELNLEIHHVLTNFESTDSMVVSVSEIIKEKPNIIFISTGRAALSAREDLGTTVSNLKKMAQVFQENGIFVVHLGINPPGVGDNWSMGITHACKEVKILCIEDVFAGEYQGIDLKDLRMNEPSYQKAVQTIAATVKPHLVLKQ